MTIIAGIEFEELITYKIEKENSEKLYATNETGVTVIVEKKQIQENVTVITYDITTEKPEEGEEIDNYLFLERYNAMIGILSEDMQW